MKIIDVEAWDRKVPYKNFVRYNNPIFSLAARLDVTSVYERSKRTGRSFFSDFLFLVTASLNRVESLRLRMDNEGRVVLYESIDPSFIVMQENGVIATCRTPFTEDYEAFYQAVREGISRKSSMEDVIEEFNSKDATPDVFYSTCLPWLDFVSMSNPYHYEDVAASSIPRLSWGKFVDEGGRRRLTFDIAAHHALLDGKAICDGFAVMSAALEKGDAFFEAPKESLDEICASLGIFDKL